MLIKELLLATAMVGAIVIVHLIGLALLIRALKSHSRLFRSL